MCSSTLLYDLFLFDNINIYFRIKKHILSSIIPLKNITKTIKRQQFNDIIFDCLQIIYSIINKKNELKIN